MGNRSSLRAAAKRPLRAIEEAVVTVVLIASVLLPVVHLIPSGSGDDTIAVEELHCAVELDPEKCGVAGEALEWAVGVAAWKFPDLDADHHLVDAFTQCAWTGAVSQRLGTERASAVSTVHERVQEQSDDQMDMDLANASIGIDVGHESNTVGVADTWGWIIDECEGRAAERLLYGPGGVLGRY